MGNGAIVITYSSSTSEAAQISDRGSSITAHLPTHIKDPSDPDPDYLAVWLYEKAGVAEAWWRDWLRGKRRLAHRSASDWSEENNCCYPHRQCIGGSLGRPLSLADAG